MNATQKLPPSGRDFEVYTAVRVQERTTREVAAEFGISQTRVCQIVERVGLFMLDAAPEGTEENHAKRVQLAEQVAALRVQHLYGTAVRDYEASKGKPVIREINAEGRPRTTITTTKVDVGDVKLLDRAVKFAVVSAKLPVATLAQHVAWEEESREEEGEAQEASELISPAEVDCSTEKPEQAASAPEALRDRDAKLQPDESCDLAAASGERRNVSAAGPVQPAVQLTDIESQSAPTTAPARELDPSRKKARRNFFAAAG